MNEHEPNGEREPHDELDGGDVSDEALARLRDADPAAAVEPRPGFADQLVTRITAGEAEATALQLQDDTIGAEAAPVVDLAGERSRRRPRWLAIAAAAASIAIVGGAGFWAGAAAQGGSVEAAAPPITLQSGGGTQQGAADSSVGGPEQAKLAPGATDLMYPYGFGRNSFHATGLSTTAGSAAGYAYDARAVSNAASVSALAAALGLTGEPELKDGSWTVGATDGSGPALWVGLDGTASFSYSDPGVNPWVCSDDGATCAPSGALPSADAAIAALRSLITATGRDPVAYAFTSETWDGAATRTAQAWPVIDGQQLDQGWSVELAEGGMVSASGQLADLVGLGEYPIVSAQQAFERLSDPRFGAQATIMPFAARAEAGAVAGATDDAAASEEWVPPTEPPAAPGAGTAIAWPVNEVEIVGVRLGLASQWQPDGSVVVVPAYEFTDSAGGTWSVIAVDESKLDLTGE